MALNLQQGTLADIDFLIETRLEVLRAVFDISPDQDMSKLAETNRDYYTKSIPSGEHLACLAFEGDKFAGSGGICFYNIMPSLDNTNGKCGYIMNMHTRPNFRRKGVASAIICWLLDHAKQRNVTEITLEATPTGKLVYEKLGFVPLENNMLYFNKHA